jgi:hypothetical protein
MGAILAIILPLLAKIPGQIGEYFQTKQEIEKIKLENQRQEVLAQAKLAGEIALANLEFQKVALASTGSMFKYFTFFMWFGPYMSQIIYPPLGKQIFDNMLGMPEWYAQSCVLIMFTIWGISVSAPVVSNIFTGLGHFFQARRDYKIEKAKVDRKAFFDGMRKLFPKGMTPQQVEIMDNALDEGEK